VGEAVVLILVVVVVGGVEERGTGVRGEVGAQHEHVEVGAGARSARHRNCGGPPSVA
jgi:hypothetical protein